MSQPTQTTESIPDKPSASPVLSLAKALEILELFVEAQELGTREIARLSGHNRSTVHRILITFQQYGYLVQNPADGRFRLAVKFLKLGSMAVRRFDLRDLARPFMRDLARDVQESVFLHIQESPESVVCIEEVLVNRTLSIGAGLGISTPVFAAAAGKVFLAHQPVEEVRRLLLRQRPTRITRFTITDPDTLLADIEQARRLGYAMNNEESEIGACYVAVPIYDRDQNVVGTLNVGAPVARLTDNKIEPLARRMKAAAADISAQM